VNSQAQQHAQSYEQQHPAGQECAYNRPSGSTGGFNSQEMNQELQNRQRGETQSQRSNVGAAVAVLKVEAAAASAAGDDNLAAGGSVLRNRSCFRPAWGFDRG